MCGTEQLHARFDNVHLHHCRRQEGAIATYLITEIKKSFNFFVWRHFLMTYDLMDTNWLPTSDYVCTCSYVCNMLYASVVYSSYIATREGSYSFFIIFMYSPGA
jgi:hypothetical protein